MKKLYILVIICAFAIAIQAQTKVTLTFTGQLLDGSYIQLDSVQVFNITQSWNETLYYPDTILEMETDPVSITLFEDNSLELSSAIPNPFNGTTDIALQLQQDETVTFSLYDINGKEYLSRSMQLGSGKHNLKLSTVTPQIYFLQVQTSTGSKSIKLLNQGQGASFDITHSSFGEAWSEAKTVKLVTTNKFVANDEMRFIGYRTKDNEIDTIQIRTRQAVSNTNYTFNYQISYKVGDVYYENGIAEGMVWWLADTILMVGDVAYGEHGKLITLIEPANPGTQTGLMWGVCSQNIKVPSYDTLDGRINTAIIKHIRDSLQNEPSTPYGAWRYQAMSWCVDTLGGDWYLPALSELRALYGVIVPILNPALTNISGAKTFSTNPNSTYWSSTADETDNLAAYVMRFYNYPNHSDIPDYVSFAAEQNEYFRVRAMKWF